MMLVEFSAPSTDFTVEMIAPAWKTCSEESRPYARQFAKQGVRIDLI